MIWSVPTFPRYPIATPRQLYSATKKHVVRGLPIALGTFPVGFVHPLFEGVFSAEQSLSDYVYTEVQQQGLIYSEIEFWWDQHSQDLFVIDALAPLLWAAAQFSTRLYEGCGYFGLFDVCLRLVGVRDRYIHTEAFSFRPRIMDDVIEVSARTAVGTSQDELVVRCKEMIREVYWSFGWDKPNEKMIDAVFR